MTGGVDGLASGLPTADLIDAMIEGARGATRLTESKKELFELRLEAVRTLNTRLLSARLDSAVLKQSSTFTSRVASSTNTDVMTADANSNAIPGSYALEVTNIASAHQLAAQGQSSQNQVIGSGDVVLQVGNGTQTTISLTDASLEDIASAINDEDLGITASVINDGQSDPYRLVLQSDQTGDDYAITVSGTDDFATLMNQGNMDELSEALDASINFGSGGGAILIESDTNELSELIPGVDLTLVGAGSVTVNVGTDTSDAQTAITTFVDSVNSSIEYFRTNASYDTETNEAGILFSENDIRRSIESLTRTLTDPVEGLPSDLNMFTAIGIDVDQNTGLFTIDTNKLNSKLSSDPDGVADLFMNRGESSDSSVKFAAMSAATEVDSAFDIEITTPATQAIVGSLGDLGASTVIDSSNSGLGLIINDTNYFVTMTEGSYTRSELADHLQTIINDAVDSNGSEVEVSLDGDALDLRSKNYGSAQSISVLSGNAQTTLNLSTTQADGVDVAGTIDGETATGIGQVLQGVEGESSEGLRLLVTANSAVSGVTLDVYEGMGQRLTSVLEGLTDSDSGVVPLKEDSLTESILDFQSQIDEVNERLEIRKRRLEAQFLQMERLLGQFQSQENFLQGQIAGFQNMAAARANQ